MKGFKNIFNECQIAMLLALCVGGFSACGDDADENSQPSLPTFEEVCAKYVATDEAELIKIVELTPDAHFIVAAADGDEPGIVRYGSYSILAEDKFQLNGYGSLEVKSLGTDTYALTVTPTDGNAIQLRTSKRKAIEGGTLTDRLVGAWQTTALKVQLERNGSTFIKTFKATEMEELEKELRSWAQQFATEVTATQVNSEVKWLMEAYRTSFTSFVFTRFGTYLVMNEKGSECVWWQWEDESQGLLRFFWVEGDMYDKEESGVARIGYADGSLTVTQDFKGYFTETLTNFCEVMK